MRGGELRKLITDQIAALGGIESMEDHAAGEEELLQIEKALGTGLPFTYRKLLSEYGSFAFGMAVKFLPLNRHPRIYTTGPDVFFGSKADGFKGVLFQHERMKNRLPPTLIPIGKNIFGDLVCLGVAGKEKGKIFYWDHENEPDRAQYRAIHGDDVPLPRDLLFQNVHLIAKSFDDLIGRLRIWEEAGRPPA